MNGYTKLFGSIIASTIWREPNAVRILWITMLAMSDKNGIVEASVPGLADMARISIDDCKSCLRVLESPDEYSRTTAHEGRRIAPAEGGWLILNHALYRAKMGVDERREYLRVAQAKHRARKLSVNNDHDKSTESTHTEAKASPKAKAKATQKQTKATAGAEDVFVELSEDFKNSGEFQENWLEFVEHRKRIKAPLTTHAVHLIALDFKQWGLSQSIQSIQATLKGGKWTGLFEPKQNTSAPLNKTSGASMNAKDRAAIPVYDPPGDGSDE